MFNRVSTMSTTCTECDMEFSRKDAMMRNKINRHGTTHPYPCGKYGSRPANGATLGRYIHRLQFKGRVLRPYWKTTLFKGLREFHEETLSYLDIQHVRVQEEGSTVCGHHCMFYLIHRCAGHIMADVTRLLENPMEATIIVKKFA